MIYFFPSKGKNQPSSYLRVFLVAPELQKRGFEVCVVNPNLSNQDKLKIVNNTKAGDVLYIQKFYSPFHTAKNFISVKGKCKIIYDFDDRDVMQGQRGLVAIADVVIVGSHFLREITLPYHSQVCVLCSPTDTNLYKPIFNKKPNLFPIIIWSEWYANAYLEDLAVVYSPIIKLCEEFRFKFVLQGWHPEAGPYRKELDKARSMFPFAIFDNYRPVERFEKEGVPILQQADIGIIPFKRKNSKAGQNLRSFMSMGLAVVGSPRSEQQYIIEDGVNGFLAEDEQQWYDKLRYLLVNPVERQRMGREAIKTIEMKYSMPIYIEKLIKVLKSI